MKDIEKDLQQCSKCGTMKHSLICSRCVKQALSEQKQEMIKAVEGMKTKTEMNPTTATGVAIMERLHERNKLLEEITTKLKNI